MSEQKRYTAQEMRDTLKCLYVNMIVGMRGLYCAVNSNDVIAMLRQAADAEDENAQLNSRLETVVKMLEEKERATSCSDCGRYNGYPCADHDECGLFKHHEEFTAILRVARGEGGAE